MAKRKTEDLKLTLQCVSTGATAVPRQAIDMNTYRYVNTNKSMYTQKGMIQLI